MFKDFKEFQQFMIFCHTHYELNDAWHFENGDKGILFEGWHNNETGNQKYSPAKLNEEDQPTYKKRTKLEEVYEVWQKVRANLPKVNEEKLKLAKKVKEAINFIQCCTQLKDKVKLTFDEYTEKFYISNGFTYESKRTGKLADINEITERYRWYSKNL